MSALGRVSRDTGRRAASEIAAKKSAFQVAAFEPSFVREILAEQREAALQEDEDYAYRASVGTGDDDWTGSVNE